MILADVGQTIPLDLVLEDGTTTSFPQAVVYPSTGSSTPLATINLVHVAGGYYFGSFTVPTSSKFIVVYTVYTDVGHTIVDNVHGKSEDLIVADANESTASAEAQLNAAYDDSGQLFKAVVWLDRGGRTVASTISATITLKDESNALVFTATSGSPFANGIFFFTRPALPLLDNHIYWIEVSVSDSLGAVSTIQTFTTVG